MDLTPMPTARALCAVGVVKDVLYAVGGFDVRGNPTGSVEAFHVTTNAWSVVAPLPTPRGNLAAGVVSGLLYAAGGFGSTNSLSTLEAYTP